MTQSPWDQPSYGGRKKAKKAPAKKVAKRPPARAPRVPTIRRSMRKLPVYKYQPEACNRSPCGAYDPKLSAEEIDAAKKYVRAGNAGKKQHRKIALDKGGLPKGKWEKVEGGRGKGKFRPKYVSTGRKAYRPLPGRPLAVAYGLGLDSTAILVGLVQEHRRNPRGGWRPEVITFADTGNEKGVTYAYLVKMNACLVKNGFPPVTVVAWRTDFTWKGWGAAQTLEQQVLLNQSGPSITEYFGAKSKCSSLWKQSPQNDWMRKFSGLWERKKGNWYPIGGKIVKAIGYDSTEERRMAPDGGGSGATFRTGKQQRDDGYRYWYPLVEWGWDRARCRAEVEFAMGTAPPKSACSYCFASKPEECVSLSKGEMKRAVFMELVRRHGRQAYRFKWKAAHGLASKDPGAGVKGLAGGWSWTDLFVNGAMQTLEGKYSEERRRKIDQKVFERFGTRTCLTRREVAQLDKTAQEFVARSADKGRSVQVDTLSKARIVKKFGSLPKTGSKPEDLAAWRKIYKWALGKSPSRTASADHLSKMVLLEMKPESSKARNADVRFRGKRDMSLDPWVQNLPAWKDISGFRGTRAMSWARNPADEASGFTSDTLHVPTDLYGIAWPIT